MGTEVTDSVQSTPLELAPYQALEDTLRALLATKPLLTLLVLVGEVPTGDTGDALYSVKACLDDVEQLLLACFRRSDRVVRCGEGSCAAILLGAELDGALRALHRFQHLLGSCKPLALSLRVGMAAAPEQASESQALLALALQPRLRIQPAKDAGPGALPRMDALAEGELSMPLELARSSAAQKKGGFAAAYLGPALVAPPASELAPESRRMFRGAEPTQYAGALTRARARALGIPYIAPPQRIPGSVRNLLSVEVMRQLRCLPIGRDRNALTVALVDPTDRGVLRRLEQLTGLTIFPVMTDPDALEALAPPARPRRASRVASPSARPSGD